MPDMNALAELALCDRCGGHGKVWVDEEVRRHRVARPMTRRFPDAEVRQTLARRRGSA